MQKYQQADPVATAELVRTLSPMLLRFLAGPIQTRAHAEDMLQECWLRVHKARHTYRPGSPVLPWIFAIARYTRVDAYRRRSSIDRRELPSEDLETAAPGAAEPEPSTGLDLWRLVGELPDSQQEVVKLLKVSGMSLEEVARATGGTVGSVKQKAHRAYRKLREMLEQRGFPGGGGAR
ncbi:MAG: sigma-70 family RNA polymerase sigma factor [Acidobacteria bacterium]|nr:sigma-70 family RNA polymerase sigma factor [Acidobacteriota bacterium]